MNPNDLLHSMGEIPEHYIEEACPHAELQSVRVKKKSSHTIWLSVAACLCLMVGAVAVLKSGIFSKNKVTQTPQVAVQTDPSQEVSIPENTAEVISCNRNVSIYKGDLSTGEFHIGAPFSQSEITGLQFVQEMAQLPQDFEETNNDLYIGYLKPEWTTSEYADRSYAYKNDYGAYTMAADGTCIYTQGSNQSIVRCSEDENILWEITQTDFLIDNIFALHSGFVICGDIEDVLWLSRYDLQGNCLWTVKSENGFGYEYVSHVIEEEDGTLAVFSLGDYTTLCFSRYDGSARVDFAKIPAKYRRISELHPTHFGYAVLLSGTSAVPDDILLLNRDGTAIGAYAYGIDGEILHLSHITLSDDKLYLSGYLQQTVDAETERFWTDGLYQFDEWPSTYLVTNEMRDKFTAVLLVCDLDSGIAQEVYTAQGSYGGAVRLSESGEIEWDVENIAKVISSPTINSWSYQSTCVICRYRISHYITKEETTEYATHQH